MQKRLRDRTIYHNMWNTIKRSIRLAGEKRLWYADARSFTGAPIHGSPFECALVLIAKMSRPAMTSLWIIHYRWRESAIAHAPFWFLPCQSSRHRKREERENELQSIIFSIWNQESRNNKGMRNDTFENLLMVSKFNLFFWQCIQPQACVITIQPHAGL